MPRRTTTKRVEQDLQMEQMKVAEAKCGVTFLILMPRKSNRAFRRHEMFTARIISNSTNRSCNIKCTIIIKEISLVHSSSKIWDPLNKLA